MSEQGTLSDKPCGATADWILGYLANECSLDMGCVSPADFLAITNAIHNHEIVEIDRLCAAKTAALKLADERAKEACDLRAALGKIHDLQDRSFVSGEGKFIRALMIARAALTEGGSQE